MDSTEQKGRPNPGVIIIPVVVTLFVILGFGPLIWFCVLKKRRKSSILVCLGLRKKPSNADNNAPLDPSGIEVVDPNDPSLFHKPELYAGVGSDEEHKEGGFVKYRQSAQGTLYELDTYDTRSGSAVFAVPPELHNHPVHQISDCQNNSSIDLVTQLFPHSKHIYQAQELRETPPTLPALNTGSPISTIPDTHERTSVHPSSASLSLSPPEDAGWRYVGEDVQRLEEEERRIDAEIEQVRRLKELREQKFEIQRKLMEAKTGIRDV